MNRPPLRSLLEVSDAIHVVVVGNGKNFNSKLHGSVYDGQCMLAGTASRRLPSVASGIVAGIYLKGAPKESRATLGRNPGLPPIFTVRHGSIQPLRLALSGRAMDPCTPWPFRHDNTDVP